MSQLLLSELSALSSEAKRKCPEVRTASDAALHALRSNGEHVLNAKGTLATAADDNVLLQPIILACEGKSATPKVVGIAVGLLQRVIGLRIVRDADCPMLVDILQHVVTTRVDVDIHLKVLQAVSSLLSTYASIHQALLAKTLRLCFQLQDSRVGVVSSTAAATLRQAVMTVFEKVRDEDRVLDGIKAGGEDAAAAAPLAAMTVQLPASNSVTLFPCSQDAYLILSDLNTLANNEPAEFLGLSMLSRTFTLELIESILTNHAHLFRNDTHPELLLCLRQSTCPLLIKAFNEQPSFPTTLRLMRLLFVLLRQFSGELIVEVEILVTILLRFIATSSTSASDAKRTSSDRLSYEGMPSWQRVLAMEATRSLCSDGVLMRNLWKWFDGASSSVRVFTQLVDTLHKLATENPTLIGQADAKHQMQPASSSSKGKSDTIRSSTSDRPTQRRNSSSVGLYNAAAGVANAAIGGLTSVTDLTLGSGSSLGLSQTSVPSVQLIDQLDKSDAPVVPATYLYLLALQSLVHLAQSLAAFVLPTYSRFVNARPRSAPRAPPSLDFGTLTAQDRRELECARDMIQQCWAPVLDSFTFFLSSKCDDVLFAEVLIALRNFTNTTGALGLASPRDALIASLTRFAIPRDIMTKLYSIRSRPNTSEDVDASLSERNAACLKAVTQIAYYLSGSLDTHWRDVLETLCDAEYILHRSGNRRRNSEAEGQPASPVDAYKPRQSLASISALSTIPPGFSSAAAIDATTGKPFALTQIDNLTLLADVARVFENTSALGDACLLPFIEALCELDADHIGLSTADGKASALSRSSPLSSLGVVSMLNVKRIAQSSELAQAWELITQHMLTVLSTSTLRPALRAQAASSLDAFVQAALQSQLSSKETEAKVQRRAIDVLSKQSILNGKRGSTADIEVRKSGLTTFLTILEAHGHNLSLGWESIFAVFIAACNPAQSDEDKGAVPLIKVAFSAMQVICSNLLAKLDQTQLKLCVETLTRFTLQNEEVNVALTASGALWGITAEVSSRSERTSGTNGDVKGGALDIAVAQDTTEMWIHILANVKQLTNDARLQVRNGAISILFSILEQYGSVLSESVWHQSIMGKVLLPLLKELHQKSLASEKPEQRKEWDESRTVALSSTGKVVRQSFTTKLLGAQDVWQGVLECLRTDFLHGPSVVSQASIRALQHILQANVPKEKEMEILSAWQVAWQTWCAMGRDLNSSSNEFTQANLTGYVETLTPLYALLGSRMADEQVSDTLTSLKLAMMYSKDTSERIMDKERLTALQSAIMSRITTFHMSSSVVAARILSDLAEFSTLAFIGSGSGSSSASSASYIALNRSSTEAMTSLYEQRANDVELYGQGAVRQLFAALSLPLKLRYDCPKSASADAAPLWKGSMASLCKVATLCCKSLDTLNVDAQTTQGVWTSMVGAFVAALRANCTPILDLGYEKQSVEEAFDLIMLATIERELWPRLGKPIVPDTCTIDLALALATTSRLVADEVEMQNAWQGAGENPSDAESGARTPDKSIKQSGYVSAERVPRETFAYWCLDLLMLMCASSPPMLHADVTHLRRTAALSLPLLVDRIQVTLTSFIEGARIRGAGPLGRVRNEEINYIFFKLARLNLWPDSLIVALSIQSKHVQGDEVNTLLKSYMHGEHRRSMDRNREEDHSHSTTLTTNSPFALLYHFYPSLCEFLLVVMPRESGRASAMTQSICGSARLYERVTLPDGFSLGQVGQPFVNDDAHHTYPAHLSVDGEASFHPDGATQGQQQEALHQPFLVDSRVLVRELLEIVGRAWR